MAVLTALPVKLHFNAMIAISVDWTAAAYNYGSLLAEDSRLGMQHAALVIAIQAAIRNAAVDHIHAVAVQGAFAHGIAGCV